MPLDGLVGSHRAERRLQRLRHHHDGAADVVVDLGHDQQLHAPGDHIDLGDHAQLHDHRSADYDQHDVAAR